jgi:hypothetical protein
VFRQKIEAWGDSAYGSGDLLADITKAGHTPDHQADWASQKV